MHLFTADGFTGKLRSCDEGDLEWIKKSDLLSLKLWEGDKIFLRLLDSPEPFFSLKLQYEGETLVFAQLNGQKLPLSSQQHIG
jgi:8-oxo-dGTP diphosphatase